MHRLNFGASPGLVAVALLVLAFLVLFLALPVGNVFYLAFINADGSFTLGHFTAFFHQPLLQDSFYNSLYVAIVATLIASLIAIPLAYLTVRFQFRGAILIQTLGVLPLIMPPFVGAVAMQLIFGRAGSVNLLLDDWFGFTVPLMDGLVGVTFVESESRGTSEAVGVAGDAVEVGDVLDVDDQLGLPHPGRHLHHEVGSAG